MATRKRTLKKGTCRIIKTSAGRRKLCRLRNGRVQFAKLGGTKKKKRATKKRKR